MRAILLASIAASVLWGQSSTGLANIAAWQANLPPYETRCAAVDTRIAAIGSPSALQADAIVNAQAWCHVLPMIRSAMVTDPSFFDSFSFNATKAEHWTSGAEYFIGKAELNQDPFADAVIMTRAFKSVQDKGFLYYLVQLPQTYASPTTYGADIYFHTSGNLAFYWGNTSTPLTGADGWWVKPSSTGGTTNGRIYMKPSARSETDYRYMGAAGADEEIAHFLSTYSVDADRIVLGGGSAGGAGSMRYNAIRPDLAAAAYNMTGGLTYGGVANTFWYNQLMQTNFSVMPFLHWYCPLAQESNYTEQHTSLLYLQTQAGSYPGSYEVYDGLDTAPACSHVNIQEPALSNGWTWLRGKVMNRWPDRVILTTLGLGVVNSSRWVTIDTEVNSKTQATINAFVDRTSTPAIAVTATNIDRFTLNLSASLLPSQSTVSVTINGATPLAAPVGGSVHFWRTGTAPEAWSINASQYPAMPVKKKGISGPIVDLFMQVKPILWVYGTAAGQSDATQQALVKSIIDKMFPTSLLSNRRTQRSDFAGQIKRDVDVTNGDTATSNIILIGNALQNSYVNGLVSFGGGLPIQWPSGATFRVNSVTYTEGQNKCSSTGALGDPTGCSYVAIFPNPRNQNNYIILLPENYIFGSLAQTNMAVENADIFVGYLSSGYPSKKASIALPQNWGTTGSGSVAIDVTSVPGNPAVGDTVTFTASGGSAPYTWTVAGCGTGNYTGNPITCSYALAGTRAYSVVDAVGNNGSGSVTVSGAAPPVPVTVSPPTRTGLVNTLLTWTVSGGTGPFTWSAPSCSPDTGTGTSFSCSYPAAGDYTITATDSVGTAGGSTVTMSQPVQPPPTGRGTKISGRVVFQGRVKTQ